MARQNQKIIESSWFTSGPVKVALSAGAAAAAVALWAMVSLDFDILVAAIVAGVGGAASAGAMYAWVRRWEQ